MRTLQEKGWDSNAEQNLICKKLTFKRKKTTNELTLQIEMKFTKSDNFCVDVSVFGKQTNQEINEKASFLHLL